MAIPVLGIAFGFFIGCSVLPPLDKSQSQTDDALKERLAEINSQISANPDNAEAHYQKGDVLTKLAQQQDRPGNRVNYYTEMHQTLAEAESLYETSENLQGSERVDELLQVSWSFEHNQGVEFLQTDSTLESSNFNRAAAHFNNAIIIIPDSSISYKMKARALYRNHQVEEAIQTLETATNRIEDLPPSFLEQLAYLYLETDQTSNAINLYEKAEGFSGQNLNLIHGLANAYITANKHRKAVQLLARLVENEPENIIYIEAYGTELYNLGIQQYDSLQTSNPKDSVAIRQIKSEADTLLQRAENHYKKILKQNPASTEVKQKLANLYKNHAVELTQVKQLFSEDKRQEIDSNIEAFLSDAITLYEELAEAQPDETSYWENLYQAYSYLGMQEEAAEAKANL